MSQGWKAKWVCNNCKAEVQGSKKKCQDCGNGWWYYTKAASERQAAWSRGRSHSRKRWTSREWEPDSTGAGTQAEKEDSEAHFSGEEEGDNSEEVTPEECLKHVAELETVLTSCKNVPNCRAIAHEVAVKVKAKRKLWEELTRKPSEARLRSLLDRKYDRKFKLDALDKHIAGFQANLAITKEQHDAYTKDLEAIQIEVTNVMKVLNITPEQADRIPPGPPNAGR